MAAMKLGKKSAERELQVLQALNTYREEATCPAWYIEKVLSEKYKSRLWPDQLWLIIDDLAEYGLVKIHSDGQLRGWDRYSLTKKGKEYLHATSF